jgi:hypothetical protein
MWSCAECRYSTTAWRSFKKHMLARHQVAERNLVRRAAQLAEAVDVVAVRSANGSWFLFGQGPLL